MSRTNLQVITDAMRLAGITNQIETPSAEDSAEALNRMNDMILGWDRHNGIRLGYYPQTSLSANIPIDDEYFEALTALLAKKLCWVFSFGVSPELFDEANKAWSALLAEFASPEPADLRHAPGARRTTYDINSDSGL